MTAQANTTRSTKTTTKKASAKPEAKPAAKTAATPARTLPYEVRNSPVHGRGVFAIRKIAEGSRIIEYKGERITGDEAVRRENLKPADDFHTFFFSLDDGNIIDGGSKGNNARWINHSCEPNCQAQEDDGRVFIYALRDIAPGEELNYDYGLIIDERLTPTLKRNYRCLCGSAECRGTLLATKKKKKRA
ncbi:SET domain-containing protein [Oxalobacteraceae bacterium OM1]|nr:SET domain-containing protein [Oxalobacteraceae bacterium OM1]